MSVLDILFSEPDRTSLDNIKKSYKQDFGLDLNFEGVSSGLSNNDGYFGHVLSSTRVVGARFFTLITSASLKSPSGLSSTSQEKREY